MGWSGYRWELSVLVDAHGGAKEDEQEALWAELKARLEAVVSDPKFRDIVPGWEPGE